MRSCLIAMVLLPIALTAALLIASLPMPDSHLSRKFLQLLKPRLPQMLGMLRRFVTAESPSLEKTAADRCCGVIAEAWNKHGARVEQIAQKHRGDLLRITYAPGKSRSASQLLVLGHYDTVYATGTLARTPFRIAGGKAYGPGTFDMKAGIVQALFALHALQQSKTPLRKRVVFLWTSDEEIGSEASRKFLEAEARRSDAVFVLEPSFGPRGLLKTARKGVGEAELIVHGRASHAGLAPQEGVNAIHELARQLARIEKWNDLRRGVTINAGVIEGGTHTNVIPERARAVLDLRALRLSDMRGLERRLRTLRPFHRDARLEITGGFDRPPLEHKMSAALFVRAKSLAKQMNLPVGECTVGGGSDGNFTAALGIPTLDGLGAVGDGAHSRGEHILINTMPQRAALLAALLASL
jgi:glutamate carboxypeptidase